MNPDILNPRALDERFVVKVFMAFAALAVVALALNVAGRFAGASIALGGHSTDTTTREVVIGNDVVVAPANAIRFDHARHDGVAQRLDLYLRWPDMTGYSNAARDDFNIVGGRKALIYMTLEPRTMSRDMSGRLDPIYRSLIEPAGEKSDSGVLMHRFTEKSGYLGEMLAIKARPGGEALVARCLHGAAAAELLAPCERDIQVGDDLSLTYRFPAELLAAWPKLEYAVRAKALEMVKTASR
ncbi:MAG: hypothetical protein IPL47_14465 [Phyllobacteriaceae bacterium]|nr:hypothetical protein [Phyllobacteriaceae bacterium]